MADAPKILPLELGPNGLGGAGGERLRAELGKAQFVAIGEDHGFKGPPQLAEAITTELVMASRKPVYLVAEAGPLATAWFASVVKTGGLPALHAAIKPQPYVLPFLNNVEDARLAEPFARNARLWGIDQEFVGSTAQLFEGFAAQCANAANAAQLRDWAKSDRTALNQGRFDQVALSAVAPERLLEAGAGCGSGKLAQNMAAIAQSARIYQYNNTGEYARNNEERATLMAATFMANYRAARKTVPRVVLKMGAYHLGRGTTPTRIYDLGSYLPALAAENGLESLHIAWVPIGGTVRIVAPKEGRFTAVDPYVDEAVMPLLEAAGVKPELIPAKGLVLIPMQPVRYTITGKKLRDLPELSRFIILGYDYLVTTRDAQAATNFEAW